MAKRRRLDVPAETVSRDLETEYAFATPHARMPIAEVAGDTAGRAALEEIAREMTLASDEGRVIRKLPIDKVITHHLARDRMVLDEDDMAALKASIADRGQQTPIEVVALHGGNYGLISGLRRVAAMRELGVSEVHALVRRPETSQDAYRAMVEENEIRSDLSFYERANIAVTSVGQKVYPDPRAAVKALFAHAPKAKRSKILKFVTICEVLGSELSFPHAIPEHLGLKLSMAIETDPAAITRIRKALRATPPSDAAEERRILEAGLQDSKPAPTREEIAPGLRLEAKTGRVVLSGNAVDEVFVSALKAWASTRNL